MASTFNNQVPYETTKDCSQGFCSIYCPQWCYIIFPPPPPFSFDDDDDNLSGRPTLSPLVIAIIGILASAFLLVSYYTIISKYCGGSFRRRRAHRNHLGPDDGDVGDDIVSQSRLHEAWHVSPSNGLDEALINKIVVCKYKRGDGLVDSTDCSVCLGEFREDDSLRLLPKCSHAFHLQCIDTWLKSHSNCPLCRANIVLMNPAPAQLPPTTPAPGTNEPNYEMVVVIEDLERGGGGGGEETDLRNGGDASSKEPSGSQDENHGITEIRDDDGVQPIRRSFSMDCLHQSTVSIADILQMNNEDEYFVAKDHELLVGGGSSSRRSGGEHSKGSSRSRVLHSVMSPVPMKRSASSGRFCFTSQARGKNAVLPI